VTPNPSQEWLKLELSNVVQSETMSSLAKGAWLWSRDLFKFLTPYDISGKAKGRDFKLCTVVSQVAV